MYKQSQRQSTKLVGLSGRLWRIHQVILKAEPFAIFFVPQKGLRKLHGNSSLVKTRVFVAAKFYAASRT